VSAWLTPDEWGIVALSLKVSVVAVALTLPPSYALAWVLARRRFPGVILLDALVHLPLVVPPVVTGWVLLLLFGRNGPIGGWLEAQFGVTLVFRWTGAALAAAVMALPLMVRAMRLSIEAVDRRLVDAARTLGASRWRAFLTITLPLSIPGVRRRRCSGSPARSASSAPRSLSPRTSPGRRGPCHWRSTAGSKRQAGKRWSHGCR
jgi:molybdate transport system permease protein